MLYLHFIFPMQCLLVPFVFWPACSFVCLIKGMVLIYRTANLLNCTVIKGSLINLDFVDLLLLCLESF
jgi:hypothetical protein